MANITLDKTGLAGTAGMVTIYNYDAKTGEYINTAEEYLPQGVGVPANSTIVAPLVVNANNVAIFREGKWQAIANHRGETVYAIADGAEIEVTEPGDYPARTTTLKPATEFDKWDGIKWVTDTDAQHQSRVSSFARQKSALISEANSITQVWQTQLLLGIITDEDKATLTKWMKYIQEIQAINISDVTEIIWPQKPQ